MGYKKVMGIAIATIVAYKGIKIAKKKARKNKHNQLGIDWDNLLNHTADPLDFAKQFKKEMKWALQRVFKGYDDRIFWNFDNYLDQMIILDLKWMLKHRNGSPALEEWADEDCHEKWTQTLKQMLRYFMESTEQHCSQVNEYEGQVDFSSYSLPSKCGKYRTMHYKDTSKKAETLREKYYRRGKEIDAYRAKNHKKALEMLTKYYRHLWD